MARPLRIQFEGAFYHVMSRGNKRENIFFDRQDYRTFLDTLEQTCERFGWIVHAYCLMTNHYHILVETPQANLSKGMHFLNGVFTQRINRKHERCGHLFQGRFTGILVDTHHYYKILLRYVLQNPVKANIFDHPRQYYWSSYNATIGRYEAPDWLAVHEVLAHFAQSLPLALGKFEQYILDKEELDMQKLLTNQVFLGDKEFVRAHLNKRTVRSKSSGVSRRQSRPPAWPLAHYKERYSGKKKAVIEAYKSGSYSKLELAKFFEIPYTTLSRWLSKK
ncbi:addiction module toxin RelE [Aliidiomarina minuta]|uniref:Addiction module toxin RelE n=1 Tax=Aliidiomarina minuta TaxID=880057 RepID=A0A432W8E6_9GAMM|nr:transposase [Aliidiomarina minuta]RUO26236.1 addiction module toxin RelE [Aliidiomarina minuta]